jgi:hypothetical protein
MALPIGSGQVSLNDVHVEVGGTTNTQVGLGDTDVRDWVDKTSGEITMGDFIIPSGINSDFNWDNVADFTITTYPSGDTTYPITSVVCQLQLRTDGQIALSSNPTTGALVIDATKDWISSSAYDESLFELTYSYVSGDTLETLPTNGGNLGTARLFRMSGSQTRTDAHIGVYDITVTYTSHKSINGTVRVTFRQIADPT